MIPSVRVLAAASPGEAERCLVTAGVGEEAARSLAACGSSRILLLEGLGGADARAISSLAALHGAAVDTVHPVSDGGCRLAVAAPLQILRSIFLPQQFDQPALASLADRAIKLLQRESFSAGLWTFGRRSLDLSRRPCIMGILNVTPDSFSDGNAYFDRSRAVDRALEMEANGADIIDIGGESTRPFSPPVDVDEELRRVVPVVEALAGRLSVPISVDTYKAAVVRAAMNAGAEIANDISGLTFDDAMAATVAETGAGLVVMHTRGTPETMQLTTGYDDIVANVISFLSQSLHRARSAGIADERVVVDPGIGFGKSLAGNLELLRRISEFAGLGRPVLLGTSRKTFIGTVLNRDVDERLFGTAATVALGVARGASIFRVHDVRAMRDVADMAHAIAYPAN